MPNSQRPPRKRPCRNCGQPAGPQFCGSCGQPVEERRGPILQTVGELFSDWFSLDSKLLRSLAALLRPGRSTQLYLEGKQAPYLRPLRLYFLSSLALFSTVLTLDAPDASRVDIYVAGELVNERTDEQAGMRGNLQFLKPDTALGRWIIRHSPDRLERFRTLPAQELLDRVFTSLRRTLPAALILFVPFLALGLKILYLRSRAFYLDHLVFALHFQSALFLALVLAWLASRVMSLGLQGSTIAYVLAALVILTSYLGLALHRLYPRSRWSTVLKTGLLLLVYAQLLGGAIGVAVFWATWTV